MSNISTKKVDASVGRAMARWIAANGVVPIAKALSTECDRRADSAQVASTSKERIDLVCVSNALDRAIEKIES